jgi:glucoamylase
VKVIDALLKTETSTGPVWHRYNGDGYGEHEDGRAFDGTGIGRGWPLLAGERAHYELAAGRPDVAERLLNVMAVQAGPGGLIPEQVWDAPDMPERELFNGRPAGSAMPLAWAHAEYLKLLRSLRDGRVFDLPPQSLQRYPVAKISAPYAFWRFNQKSRSFVAGQLLRVETLAPAVVHWSADDWRTTHDTPTGDTGLGVHVADLQTETLSPGAVVRFTFFWLEGRAWEGRNFEIRAEPQAPDAVPEEVRPASPAVGR